MSRLIDLSGQRFGRLVVICRCGTYFHKAGSAPFWLCRCDCGEKAIVLGPNLRGRTVSCGCYRRTRFGSKEEKLQRRRATSARWRERHRAEIRASQAEKRSRFRDRYRVWASRASSKRVDRLADGYVASVLRAAGVPRAAQTPELIKVKRLHLQITRAIRESN